MSTVPETPSQSASNDTQRAWAKKMGEALNVPVNLVDARYESLQKERKGVHDKQGGAAGKQVAAPPAGDQALTQILNELNAAMREVDTSVAALQTLKSPNAGTLAKRKTDLQGRVDKETKALSKPPSPKELDKLRALCKDAKTLLEDCKKSIVAAKQAAVAKAKKAYDDALAKIKTDSNKAEAVDTDKQLPLETCKADFMKKLSAMKDLAAKADYAAALEKVAPVGEAAKALNDLHGKYAKCKKLLFDDGGPDSSYLFSLAWNSQPSDKTRDSLAKYKDMMRMYYAGRYDDCTKAFKVLQDGMADLKKGVAEADKVAQPKADKAKKKFEELAGNKKLSTLDAKGQAKLVKALKKLSLKEQTDLLADLHGPSSKLDAEGRLMQRAMYKAMSFDKEFEKEDKKKREAYRAELEADTEIQDAVSAWNTKKNGKDVVPSETKQKVFEKVLKTQSKAYGIPAPAVRWYDGDADDFGGFNTTKGIISLNRRYLSDPEEMINTILHENTHNYQDQLAKRYLAGEIKVTDPVYLQAKAFALTHHMDAYVAFEEDEDVYRIQPEEMHAWSAGDSETPKLMKGLKKAKKKRDRKDRKK